ANYQSQLDALVAQIDSYVAGVVSTVQQLNNALPLLDRGAQGSLAEIVGIAQTFQQFADQAQHQIDSAIAAASGDLRLSSLVSFLNRIALTPPVDAVHFSFAGGYTTDGTTLIPAILVTIPTAHFSRTFSLDLGAQAQALGIRLDGDTSAPGVQPVQLTIDGSLGVSGLAIGIPQVSSGLPDPFLATGLRLDAGVTVTIPAISGSINLSLLAASVSFSGLTITGSVSLAPTDTSGDGKLQPSELLPSNVTPTISFTPNPLT